jgi:hypothetical protein
MIADSSKATEAAFHAVSRRKEELDRTDAAELLKHRLRHKSNMSPRPSYLQGKSSMAMNGNAMKYFQLFHHTT